MRGFPKSPVARSTAIGECIVDEHNAMTNKTIIANLYQLTDKAMRLDLAIIADHNPFLDFGKWADKTIIPNTAFIKVTGFNHPRMFPETHIPDPGFV